MIDVSLFMPLLNEMIITGDKLVQPSCWSTKFALESYSAGNMTAEQVVEMVTDAKTNLDSIIENTGEESNYSTSTTYDVIQQILNQFGGFSAT
jgi:hypothetical protein